MIRIHIWVSGRVQGVSFRYFVKNSADALGVMGWVRNLPDGRVEAVLEGNEHEVSEMIKQCRIGPGGAHVKEIKVHEEQYINEFNSFEIR